jgi:sialate O-acetylesterase
MRKISLYLGIFILVIGSIFPSFANVTLPGIFGDHMVLQQSAEVKMWGWAKANEKVKIIGTWDNVEYSVTANNNAEWEVNIKTPKAGGPYKILIQGYNSITIDDVLIGEVWLCSGQSNMEWTAKMKIDNADEEIKAANFPEIRFFSVAHRTSDVRQMDIVGSWVKCTQETMANFSAVGYFFGREIHQTLKVPVGVINSSWGGTPAEVWVNPSAIANDSELAKNASELKGRAGWPHEAGKTFNAMIAPLVPFRIAGALWYQGESNVIHSLGYTKLLSTLISNWRQEWGYEFPFYYAQIAPFKGYASTSGAMLRDAQRLVLQVPSTGMVVTSDIGNIEDIHPTNKQDVGKRFAAWALNKNYGLVTIPFSGPLYREMKIEKNKIRIYFDYAENGLKAKGKNLTHFEIAGDDQKFVPAQAVIQGNSVLVQSKFVKDPVAVRFAYDNIAEPNLFNTEGLPASCFRTDIW